VRWVSFGGRLGTGRSKWLPKVRWVTERGRESTCWQKRSPKVREPIAGRDEGRGELNSSQKVRWERSGGRLSVEVTISRLGANVITS
jgi:hypothetical protein